MTELVATSLFKGGIRKLKDGYGFIAGDDGHDYYFHWSGMDMNAKDFRELKVRERVQFKLAEVDKKLRAVNIISIQE